MTEEEVKKLFDESVSVKDIKTMVEKYQDADVIEDIIEVSMRICQKALSQKWHVVEGITYCGNKLYYHS